MPEAHVARIWHLSFPEDLKQADQSRIVHRFLDAILSERYGLSEEEREIAKTETGKPYLPKHPEICFNLSHCRGRALLAFSDIPVGVDIERVREKINLSLAKKFFSEEAYAQFVKAGASAEDFAKAWVQKEAYVKWSGEGLAAGLNQSADDAYVTLLPVGDGYQAAFCAAAPCTFLWENQNG